jgi:OFA family oxalate/formate antiporter-like MFS transporter
VVFLAWGEVYSLFSALAGDAFGTKHIGKIYGVLYTAKGIGALFVPIGNLMMEATGTWSTVLYTVATMDLIAALPGVHGAQAGVRRPRGGVQAKFSQEQGGAGTGAGVTRV